MEIFYFGRDARQLFGVWHAPHRGVTRSTGVVICPPMGHELIRGNLLCRRLAEVCSERGYPCLRFDYFGTGDSSGEAADATIAQWINDLGTATGELRHRSGCAEICLVGIHLGATLAMLYGARHGALRAVVGLNPIYGGQEYLRELRTLEVKAWSEIRSPQPEQLLVEQDRALMGMTFSKSFLAELEAVDLTALDVRPAQEIVLFESVAPEPAPHVLADAPGLSGGFDRHELGTRTRQKREDAIWTPGSAPRQVSDWLVRKCP